MTTLQKLQCYFLDLMYKNYVADLYMIDCKVDDSLINRIARYIFLLQHGCTIPSNIQCDIDNLIRFNEDFHKCEEQWSPCATAGVSTEICFVVITAPTIVIIPPTDCTTVNITELP